MLMEFSTLPYYLAPHLQYGAYIIHKRRVGVISQVVKLLLAIEIKPVNFRALLPGKSKGHSISSYKVVIDFMQPLTLQSQCFVVHDMPGLLCLGS